MTTHTVKSWPQFFQAIKAGKKLHDLRRSDRDYQVGDTLILQEYDPIRGEYTGDQITCEITFKTDNHNPCAYSSAYLDRQAVILSLKLYKFAGEDMNNALT